MALKRSQFQIDAPQAIRNRAKAVAYGRGLSLNEFVLQALAKMNDPELASLIKKYLADRSQRGRPEK